MYGSVLSIQKKEVKNFISRGERGWMGQGLDGTEGFYIRSCNDRKKSF